MFSCRPARCCIALKQTSRSRPVGVGHGPRTQNNHHRGLSSSPPAILIQTCRRSAQNFCFRHSAVSVVAAAIVLLVSNSAECLYVVRCNGRHGVMRDKWPPWMETRFARCVGNSEKFCGGDNFSSCCFDVENKTLHTAIALFTDASNYCFMNCH